MRRLLLALGLLLAAALAFGILEAWRYARSALAEPPGVQELNARAPIDSQVADSLWLEHERFARRSSG